MADRPDRNGRVPEERMSATTTGLSGRFGSGHLDDDPVDLAMVHADDTFLDTLGVAEPDLAGALSDEPADDGLTSLLLSWRNEVDSEPIGEVLDTKQAVATVHAARMRNKRRPRLLVPFAAAAAVLAIAFAGFGLAARDAQPGDTLWALTEVLYSDHARSVEAANAVRTQLEDAKAALEQGRMAEAKSSLDAAKSVLPSVSSEDGQAALEAKHAELAAQLPDNPSDPASEPPAANPTTMPGGSTDPDTSPTDSSTSSPPSSDTSSSQPPTTEPPTSVETSEPGRVEEDPETGTGGAGPGGSAPAEGDEIPAPGAPAAVPDPVETS